MSDEKKEHAQTEEDTQPQDPNPNPNKAKAAPVGKTSRFFKLAGMTASVAGSYAATRIKSIFQSKEDADRDRAAAHKASGERIAETLGQLKGAVMKVGQMASIASDLLPRELTEALGTLQKEAPPMEFAVIAEQIKKELGAPPDELFEFFDEEPFAAASIGQVHRATLDDGQEVIVKIQYPGVDEACDSDLAHLKVALRASGLVNVRKRDLDAIFAEIRDRLHEELDYRQEAKNAELFSEYYKDFPHIVVPKVIAERSTQRVITLTFEEGDPIQAVRAPRYPQEIRDQIGVQFFHLVCSQIFHLKAVHADPNPGNFAFRTDGTIVMYDFGCVKYLVPEIIDAYRDTILAGLREDYEGVEDGLRRLGVRELEGPPVEYDYYKDWRDLFLTPFIQEEPFDYGRSTLHNEVIARIPGVMKRLASFKPPAELTFLDRAIVGHYGNLRKIRAKGRFLEILQQYIDTMPPSPKVESTEVTE